MFTTKQISGFTAGVAMLAQAVACAPPADRGTVRLGPRIPASGSDLTLAVDASRAGDLRKPLILSLSRAAADIGGVALRLTGSARSLSVNWRRAGEHGFVPGRRLTIPLDAGHLDESYLVDLGREEQWLGTIDALQIASIGGPAQLQSAVLQRSSSAVRPLSLRGLTLPCLVGKDRYEIPLTKDLPEHSRLEARIGILPEFQRLGARACFSVSIADAAGGRDGARLFEKCLQADREAIHGWDSMKLDVVLPRAGALVLESVTEVAGSRVEGAAIWGDPLLVPRRPSPGPNLVLVVVDTLRADAVGAYGSRDGLTPNLDALAKRSVRLAQLHAPAPWTLPSMGSLMTGLQPQIHGGGRRVGGGAPSAVAEGVATLAETLAAQGIYTAGVYKNIYLSPEFGLHRGFDEYASYETMEGPDGAEQEANAGFLVDRAIDELERIKDRRFFLYLHLFDPHNPYEAPREWCEKFVAPTLRGGLGDAGCRVDRRPEGPMPERADYGRIRALYDAEVAYSDHELGRLFAALSSRGLEGKTVVVFASDHGEEFYERAERERDIGYEANSDHGHTLYEELLHVPAMIEAPNLAPGVVDDPVETVDLFPTVLSLLGIPAPTNSGQDLGAVLADAASGGINRARARPRPLIADVILHGATRRAVRIGNWKLIVQTGPAGQVELYDLAADPGEVDDLAAQRPDVVLALRQALGAEMVARRNLRTNLLASDGMRPAILDWSHITKLRSLGYLR